MCHEGLFPGEIIHPPLQCVCCVCVCVCAHFGQPNFEKNALTMGTFEVVLII